MPLIIKNLTKSFGDKKVFENFSYTFSEKGLFVLVGNSGRGKTTLLRMIAGLDKDFRGEITKQKAAYAFQEYRLFPSLNALENITKILWKKPKKNEIENAKKLLESFNFTQADTLLFPNELSGGMKQRVALCRAFLSNQGVLLLDEPFKELDADLRAKLCDLIEKESKKRLIIMTAHSLDMLSNLDHTIVSLEN